VLQISGRVFRFRFGLGGRRRLIMLVITARNFYIAHVLLSSFKALS